MTNFTTIKQKISPFMIKLILALGIIQVTTVVHEIGHALPVLCFTDSHITLTLGSTSQKSEELFSIGKHFDIEIAGLMPGVGMASWNGNDQLSILEKIVVCAGRPYNKFSYFLCIIFLYKASCKGKTAIYSNIYNDVLPIWIFSHDSTYYLPSSLGWLWGTAK